MFHCFRSYICWPNQALLPLYCMYVSCCYCWHKCMAIGHTKFNELFVFRQNWVYQTISSSSFVEDIINKRTRSLSMTMQNICKKLTRADHIVWPALLLLLWHEKLAAENEHLFTERDTMLHVGNWFGKRTSYEPNQYRPKLPNYICLCDPDSWHQRGQATSFRDTEIQASAINHSLHTLSYHISRY